MDGFFIYLLYLFAAPFRGCHSTLHRSATKNCNKVLIFFSLLLCFLNENSSSFAKKVKKERKKKLSHAADFFFAGLWYLPPSHPLSASPSVTPTLCISSFISLYLLPGSTIFIIHCLIYPLSLLCTCPNCHNLACQTLSFLWCTHF